MYLSWNWSVEVTLLIAWRDSLFHGFLWFWQKVLGSRKHISPYKSMYTWYIHDLYHFLQNGWLYATYHLSTRFSSLPGWLMLRVKKWKAGLLYGDYFGWWLMFHDLYWFIHGWFGIVFFGANFLDIRVSHDIPKDSKPTTLKALCTLHYEDFETSLNINMLEAWSHRLKLEKSSAFHTKNNIINPCSTSVSFLSLNFCQEKRRVPSFKFQVIFAPLQLQQHSPTRNPYIEFMDPKGGLFCRSQQCWRLFFEKMGPGGIRKMYENVENLYLLGENLNHHMDELYINIFMKPHILRLVKYYQPTEIFDGVQHGMYIRGYAFQTYSPEIWRRGIQNCRGWYRKYRFQTVLFGLQVQVVVYCNWFFHGCVSTLEDLK